jgi:hypothetical protein
VTRIHARLLINPATDVGLIDVNYEDGVNEAAWVEAEVAVDRQTRAQSVKSYMAKATET